MNLAIVANTSWNVFNFRLGLINSLQANGYQIYIITPDDGYTQKTTQLVDVKFCRVNQLDRKGSNPFKDTLLIKEYYQIYKQNNIDIVLQFTIKPNVYGSVAASLLGIKSISNVTGLGSAFTNKSSLAFITKKVLRYGLNKSNIVVTQNNFDKLFLLETNVKNESDIIVINGSGINTEKFKPFENSHPSTNFVFLFIGRLIKDKGIFELIEAFNKIHELNPTVELHLLGEIDNGNPSAVDKKTLHNWILNNNKIKFLGHQHSIKEYINMASCIVLPSYREGLAKSLLEAMSMAKPIIASNVPGCKELIPESKNGILCESKSAESLERAMKAMLQMSNADIAKMGEEGRKLILEKYDEKIINQEYLKLVKSLLEA